MIATLLEISLSMTVVIAIALCLAPWLEKRYSARGRRLMWLLFAIRLLVPVNISLPRAPFVYSPPERVVVFRTDAPLPVDVMTENARHEAAAGEANSANYAPLFTSEQALGAIYLAGAALFMLWHLAAYLRFCAALRGKTEPLGEFEGLRYSRCPMLESPIMTGFFRPMILLPEREFTDDELTMILRHESAHYRRGDLWYKLVMLAACAAHWFNPAVHLMARRADKDLEYSCDEAVVKNEDMDFRKRYSMAVLNAMRRKTEKGASE